MQRLAAARAPHLQHLHSLPCSLAACRWCARWPQAPPPCQPMSRRSSWTLCLLRCQASSEVCLSMAWPLMASDASGARLRRHNTAIQSSLFGLNQFQALTPPAAHASLQKVALSMWHGSLLLPLAPAWWHPWRSLCLQPQRLVPLCSRPASSWRSSTSRRRRWPWLRRLPWLLLLLLHRQRLRRWQQAAAMLPSGHRKQQQRRLQRLSVLPKSPAPRQREKRLGRRLLKHQPLRLLSPGLSGQLLQLLLWKRPPQHLWQ